MLLDPTQSRRLLEHAFEHQYALLAVNADSPAAITDCLISAQEQDAPIIVETSLWQLVGHSFGHGDPVLGVARYLAQLAILANSDRFADVPVLYHTDHIKGPKTFDILEAAIAGQTLQGFQDSVLLRASTISLDSSEYSEEQNIEYVQRLCKFAQDRKLDLTFEMEAGVDDGLTPDDTARKLLEGAEHAYPGYLALWAPGVGTQHGYSADGYPGFSSDNVSRHAAIAQEITGRKIGIALHGSSGLSNADLADAVQAGVTKVNWSSDSLGIRSAAALDYYQTNAEKLARTHPEFKVTAMDNGMNAHISQAYVPWVTERLKTLNASGQGKAFLATL